MTMQNAPRTMCLMPTRTLQRFVSQTKYRGRHQQEMGADIVVIESETIGDVGIDEEPDQPAIGVQSVLMLEATPGRPIRRTSQAGQR